MSISNADRDTLRTHPHTAQLYLSVLQPDQVWCGTVAGAPSRGDRTLTVVTVSGNLANAIVGQTVMVGTSCGDDSISRRRLKGFNAGVPDIDVDENGVDWQVGDFVTIMDNFELWPVYPRILTVSPWTFFKDYDVTYTNENLTPPPVVIMGPPLVGFISGGSITFDIDGSNSYAVAQGAAITTYAWSDDGGAATTIAAPAAAVTTLTVTAAGQYWLTLTVTDSNGISQTSRRPVFVHERTGNDAPYTEFEFESSPAGDWERGGWDMRLRVRGDATESDFPDQTMVVLWCESWYAGVENEIGGNVLFAGYIKRDTIQQDWNLGFVSFEAATIEALLKQLPMFSISLQVPMDSEGRVLTRNPATWYEYDYNHLTVATAIHHLWRYHSTLFDIVDVYLPVSNTLLMIACDDFEQGDLYGQADNFARMHGIFAHVCCDKQGRVWVEEDVNMLDAAGRAAVALTWNGGIQDADRRQEIEILRMPELETSLVHLSGFSLVGIASTAIVSKAPGDVPETQGLQMDSHERQLLLSQAQANTLCGRALATANNLYKEVRIKFAGNYLGALDVVPQEWLELSLASGDTPRGIVWIDKKLVCRSLTTDIDTLNGTIKVEGVFEAEADGPDGMDGDYPTDPPDDPPDPDPPDWPPDGPGTGGLIVAWDSGEGCWILFP